MAVQHQEEPTALVILKAMDTASRVPEPKWYCWFSRQVAHIDTSLKQKVPSRGATPGRVLPGVAGTLYRGIAF